MGILNLDILGLSSGLSTLRETSGVLRVGVERLTSGASNVPSRHAPWRFGADKPKVGFLNPWWLKLGVFTAFTVGAEMPPVRLGAFICPFSPLT